jgi:hypothetical protein
MFQRLKSIIFGVENPKNTNLNMIKKIYHMQKIILPVKS